MCKYVVYYRVSTKKQGVSGLGLEAQKSATTAYLKRTNGKLVAEFTEVESGKKADRPELAKAIQRTKGTGARLLIAKLDRLARNVHFISGLTESKVAFTACDLPEANELTINILAAVAQDEAKRISERTKAALAAKKARGEQVGNPEIYKHATGDVSKANQVRFAQAKERNERIMIAIEEAKNQGNNSLRKIANYLNECGYETPRGKAFTAMAVKLVINKVNKQ